MWFHFFTGNHNPIGRWSLCDNIQWLEAGLTELGHYVTIGDTIAPQAINLLWDYFMPGHGDWLRKSRVTYGLIGTEVPDGTGFNWRRDGHWETRWPAFLDVAKGARFIWSTVESAMPYYAPFAPTAYIEFGFSERLVPYESRYDPEFDFGFFGQITPYRQEVLDKIGRRAKVRIPGRMLSPAELPAFVARCRIGICFKQSLQWPIPSSARLGRLLHAKRGIAAEYVPIPTRQGSLVPIAPPEADFADFCLERLSGRWKRDAEEAFERYRALMPMRQIMERVLDETMSGEQWAAARNRMPDNERVSAAPLLFKESDPAPVVESTYANYNIVRIGETYVAATLDLGPIDMRAILSGAATRPPEDQFIISRSVPEVQQEIDRIREERGLRITKPEIIEIYRGYNILRLGYTCVAAALELGHIDIPPILSGGKPWPPSDRLIVNPDVDALKRQIDRLGPVTRLVRIAERVRLRLNRMIG